MVGLNVNKRVTKKKKKREFVFSLTYDPDFSLFDYTEIYLIWCINSSYCPTPKGESEAEESYSRELLNKF